MPWSEKTYVELIGKRAEKKRGQWSASIPTQETLALMYGNNFSDSAESFDQILSKIDAEVKELYKKYNRKKHINKVSSPNAGSFNKCHGDWTELICGFTAWNILCELNEHREEKDGYFVYVKLPDRKNGVGDEDEDKTLWTSLLADKPNQLIAERKGRLKRANGNAVKLESSNPDAVILRLRELPEGINPIVKLEGLSEENQGILESAFCKCKGCITSADQLVAFLSIKTSTRPDRRYQWIVEGNSVKGLIAAAFDDESNNLKLGALMRDKYYAFRLKGKSNTNGANAIDADRKALIGLIMFSSLFNESAIGCVDAIDELYETLTPLDFGNSIKNICQK